MKTNTSQESDLAVRFAKIRDYYCNGNNREFAKVIGDYPANTSSYCNGKKNANLKVIMKVAHAFPKVDKTWLVFGEGDMFVENSNVETNANNSIVNNGINNGVQNQGGEDSMKEISRLISIIEEKDKQLYGIIDSKDKQIAGLIALLNSKA